MFENGKFCADERRGLTAEEKSVDAYLRSNMLAYCESNRDNVRFEPAIPFYAAKAAIATNGIFQILKRMPKGALQHAHLTAVGRIDWVIEQALSSTNCHVNWTSETNREFGKLQLKAEKDYTPVARKVADLGREKFTAALHRALTIDESDMGSNERIFSKFGTLFSRTSALTTHDSMITNYLVDAFETLWNDGVYYVELRDSLGDFSPGAAGGVERRVGQILAARKAMQARFPTFDCRIIVSGSRGDTNDVMNKLRQAHRLAAQYTNLVVGFDLVGEEHGEKLGPNLPALKQIADLVRHLGTNSVSRKHLDFLGLSTNLSYYLHDGESVWATSENLFDAAALKPKRIGHAFNLFRFPNLIPVLRTNDIALELCPISNQLLGFAPDLRTHPAAGYLNADIQCTLSSDDPMYFGNEGLSYDFWEALMGWNLDLAALKKLARNSITYSALDPDAKARLMRFWETRWNDFIAVEAAKIRAGHPSTSTSLK